MTEQEFKEKLAAVIHAMWARWMTYLFSKTTMDSSGDRTIPAAYARHWRYEMKTLYEQLPEEIKQSDRNEVEFFLPLIEEYFKQMDKPLTIFWQTCPKCNGQKHVSVPPNIPGDISTYVTGTTETYECPVCGGTGLAPLNLLGAAK